MKMEFEEPIQSNQTKTDQPKPRQVDWVDTTDSLEAVEAIKGWKNFIFAITLISLLLVQIIFWLANTGVIENGGKEKTTTEAAKMSSPPIQAEAAKTSEAVTKLEPNKAGTEKHQKIESMLNLLREINPSKVSIFLKFINTIVIFGVAVYCLILLTSVQISIAGRLGGVNHICRAFFLSLVLVILLLPWQKIFSGLAVGAVFDWQELIESCKAARAGDMLDKFVFYTRFCTLWLIVFVLLISAQVRSMRWARAILRRLEVI